MCRFQVVDSVSKCFGFPVLMVKDGVSTKRDFYHSSSPWFLLFICLHPCTETLLRSEAVFETAGERHKVLGRLAAGGSNLLYFCPISYLNCHFVFKLWIHYGVNSCSSPHTASSTMLICTMHSTASLLGTQRSQPNSFSCLLIE